MFLLIYLERMKMYEGGRFAAFCGHLPSSSKLVVLSAIYQLKANPLSYSEDVTDVVRGLCSSEKFCSFAATCNTLMGELCFRGPKELYVTYTCSNQQRKLQLNLKNAYILFFFL
jgi:hypothetical protein